MRWRWSLLLSVSALLGGCFFSLDGSLVNRRRDGGVDIPAAADGARDLRVVDSRKGDSKPAKDSVPRDTARSDRGKGG